MSEHIDVAADDPLGEASRPRAPKPEGATRVPGGNGGRLVLVHNSLRNEMRQLRDAVAEVPAVTSEAGAVRSMIDGLTLRQNIWTPGSFCASHCRILTMHHTIEDEAVFPALAARQESLAAVSSASDTSTRSSPRCWCVSATDAAWLHSWVTHPKAAFWMMQQATVDDVRRQYADIAGSPHKDAYLGLHDGRPAFLVERYDPAHEQVGRFYRVRPGDVGMHFLVAPTDDPVHGFTRVVIVTVMGSWSSPTCASSPCTGSTPPSGSVSCAPRR